MTPLLRPKPLKLGDKIGFIAPSSSIESPKDVTLAAVNIKKIGLTPFLGKYVGEKNEYLAGTDEQRAKDFTDMFANPTIKGIMCLRGGYGSIRILDKIDWDIVAANPKVFVGYSDITSLHTVINKRAGFITYHGPMATIEMLNNEIDNATISSLKENIFGLVDNLDLSKLPVETLVEGSFKGRLVGGNLATIVSTLGTPYDIHTDDSVLFLEDVREPRYKVDRMITQLRLAGKFDNISGVLIGDVTDENGDDVEVLDIIKEILEPLGVPCLYNIPTGHKLPNLTLPLGSIVEWNEQG